MAKRKRPRSNDASVPDGGWVLTGTELWSNFVPPILTDRRPRSDTDPCRAPEHCFWIRAYSPEAHPADPLTVGKWLIRVGCANVAYCWRRVREATEDGRLGVGAKVSTDQHVAAGGWGKHIICIYTADFRDRDDVARVGRRLAEIDAVRTQTLTYKPDVFTYAGRYAPNSPGEVAIYKMPPPYDRLNEYRENLEQAMAILSPRKTVEALEGPDLDAGSRGSAG